MEPRKSASELTCLNCGSLVHWTAFECESCGRDPRVKEPVIEICFPQRSPKPQTIERRKYPRYDCQGKVVLNRFFRGELVDLCQRGAKLKTVLRLFRDEVIHLDFAVKGVPIRVKARVIHVKSGVLDERFTLGVFFETIARNHTEILNHHLEEISAEKSRSPYFA